MLFKLKFFCNYKLDFFHQALKGKLSIFGETFDWKDVDLVTCIRMLLVSKFLKGANYIDSSRLVETLFLRNSGFDFLNEALNPNAHSYGG